MAFCKSSPHDIFRPLYDKNITTNITDNPFARRDTHTTSALNTYRTLVPITWALVVIVGIYYTIHSPHDVKHGHRLFKQAKKHDTPFSQNIYVTGVYWYFAA